MQVIEGIVTIVQESRFQLTADDGASALFMLSRDAALEPAQLRPLQRDQTRVRVTFRDGGDMLAGIATAITAIG